MLSRRYILYIPASQIFAVPAKKFPDLEIRTFLNSYLHLHLKRIMMRVQRGTEVANLLLLYIYIYIYFSQIRRVEYSRVE